MSDIRPIHCEACRENIAAVDIKALNLQLCQRCLEAIDKRIAEINAQPRPNDLDLLRQEYEAKLYVPGMWICPECNFSISLNYLYVNSGNIGANLSQHVAPCPNDRTPLVRLTWEQHARDAVKVGLQQVERAVEAEAHRDALALPRPYDCYWSRRALAAEAKAETLHAVLKRHHEHHQEECNVYFEQDGKPIDLVTDLGEAYSESQLCDDTLAALKL